MTDPVQVQELAALATALKESDVFKLAHFNMRKQYLQELLAAPVGSLTAQHAHAKLLALEDVVLNLDSFINDEKMRRRSKP